MKNVLIRLLVVIIFLVAGLCIIYYAPDYDINYKYKDGDLRVIFNDKEITRETSKLPEVATIINGQVMLSHNTIDILFDKDLYFEEKYNTFISTCDGRIADIEIGSNTVKIDGVESTISTPAIKTNYEYSNDDRYESDKEKIVYYIPIADLADFYDITVEFDDKLIITTNDTDIKSFTSNSDETIYLRYLEDDTSKAIDTVNPNEKIYVFNYDDTKAFNKVRSLKGEIGYLNTALISSHRLDVVSSKKENVESNKENVTIAWDYINPLSSTIGQKADRSFVGALDVVCPTLLYFENPQGEIYFMKSTMQEYMKWADRCGYDVWLTLKNDDISITKPFDIDNLSTLLNDMNYRRNAISQTISICKTYGADGINVDVEEIYLKDAKAFTQFVRELSIEAHKQNLLVSVCVNVPDGSDTWSKCYEHKLLSEACDYLCLMSYDMSKNTVSSYAPYNWVEENVKKLVERDHVEASKLLLGLTFDSAFWTVNGEQKKRSVYFMSGAKNYLNGAKWDEDAKQFYYENVSKGEYIWIEDNTSLKEKLKLLDEYNLGGCAFWVLDHETKDVWDIFKD